MATLKEVIKTATTSNSRLWAIRRQFSAAEQDMAHRRVKALLADPETRRIVLTEEQAK